jgi:flagellar motility protein MotE (MotC chaperone)
MISGAIQYIEALRDYLQHGQTLKSEDQKNIVDFCYNLSDQIHTVKEGLSRKALINKENLRKQKEEMKTLSTGGSMNRPSIKIA